MSTEDTRRQAAEAKSQADESLRAAEEQEQPVKAAAVRLSWLVQENNLAPRFRRAMRLRFGGPA